MHSLLFDEESSSREVCSSVFQPPHSFNTQNTIASPHGKHSKKAGPLSSSKQARREAAVAAAAAASAAEQARAAVTAAGAAAMAAAVASGETLRAAKKMAVAAAAVAAATAAAAAVDTPESQQALVGPYALRSCCSFVTPKISGCGENEHARNARIGRQLLLLCSITAAMRFHHNRSLHMPVVPPFEVVPCPLSLPLKES